MVQIRSFQLSTPQLALVKNYGFVINVLAGAYIGGLIVCLGLLYLMYYDANERQHIPFELSFDNHITAVKAINKDDVLKSPRYAVKHYRRLLIELAKQAEPELKYDEENEDTRYYVPLLSSDVLLYEKSNDFANFYIDIVLRYAKSLLAKGLLEPSIYTLSTIINDDDLFYKIGDAERLSQCCRLLSKVDHDSNNKISILKRSIDMLCRTFSGVNLDDNYLLQDGSKVTDEVLYCLNDLASNMARTNDKNLLNQALNIYLSNLKKLTEIKELVDNEHQAQVKYPLFNCERNNVVLSINEVRAHIGEVMWAKGYKKNAISWNEEVVEDIYFDQGGSIKGSQILVNVLNNLILMYTKTKDIRAKNRCENLLDQLQVCETDSVTWYDSVVNRFSKIIYNKGPLGILEKPISERFGRPQPVPNIEEFEEEDVE
jgi:hypothetical protein